MAASFPRSCCSQTGKGAPKTNFMSTLGIQVGLQVSSHTPGFSRIQCDKVHNHELSTSQWETDSQRVIDIIFKIPIISFVKCLPIQPLPRTECNQHMHSMGDKHFDQASEFRAICIFLYITVYVFQIIYLQNLLLLIMGGRELFKILRHLFIA